MDSNQRTCLQLTEPAIAFLSPMLWIKSSGKNQHLWRVSQYIPYAMNNSQWAYGCAIATLYVLQAPVHLEVSPEKSKQGKSSWRSRALSFGAWSSGMFRDCSMQSKWAWCLWLEGRRCKGRRCSYMGEGSKELQQLPRWQYAGGWAYMNAKTHSCKCNVLPGVMLELRHQMTSWQRGFLVLKIWFNGLCECLF